MQPGVALGRGVQIDDAPLRIEHDHAVVHAVDDHVARDRHEAEQAIAIDPQREAGAGYGEGDRREVEPVTGSAARDIEKLPIHGTMAPAMIERGLRRYGGGKRRSPRASSMVPIRIER